MRADSQDETGTDLRMLLADALLPWERRPAPRRPHTPAELGLLADWRRVAAAGSHLAMRRRLRREGLCIGQLRGSVPLIEPGWWPLFAALLRAQDDMGLTSSALVLGRDSLEARLADFGIDAGAMLLPDARKDLEQSLQDRVAALATPLARPGQLAIERFIGLDTLRLPLSRYPALVRLVAIAIDQWAGATAELLARLHQDRALLSDRFGLPPRARLTEIGTGLSDPHEHGRQVLRLSFENGLRLAYKPRNLDMEAAFAGLVEWHNALLPALDLRAPAVLARDCYGWVEWIEPADCASPAGLDAFHRRAGA
ncbi:MAG TPA: DUF4135 domain-containing protein, partial [Roseomonas sp.]